MSRRIVTAQLQAAGGGGTVDTYFDKVIKYIPADIVAAWTAVTGIIASQTVIPTEQVTTSNGQVTALWITFGVGIVLTFFWTWSQTTQQNNPPAWTQITIATIAFPVWVFALGGPFATLGFYKPWYGSLLIIGYSLFVARIEPRD